MTQKKVGELSPPDKMLLNRAQLLKRDALTAERLLSGHFAEVYGTGQRITINDDGSIWGEVPENDSGRGIEDGEGAE